MAGGGRRVPLRGASRSRCEKTPRGYAGSLCQRPQLRPNDIFRDPTHSGGGVEPTIGSGQHTAGVADGRRDPLDAVGDDLRMLHEVRLRVDYAGHDQLIVGERRGPQQAVLVRVAGVRKGQNKGPDICLKEDRRMSDKGTSQS